MLTKEKIKKTIDSLPDGFSIDDVIEKLIVLEKIEKGQDDVKKRKVYTAEEAKIRLKKWLK